jgi:hypothetical protein
VLQVVTAAPCGTTDFFLEYRHATRSDRGGAGLPSPSPTQPVTSLHRPTEPALPPARPSSAIEAVSILSPQAQANAAAGESPWPLVPAGPVHWTLQIQGLPHAGPGRGTSVAGVSLRPGQGLLLGFPLRLSDGGVCYAAGGWAGVDTFYVKERFGPFTRWVTVKFRRP